VIPESGYCSNEDGKLEPASKGVESKQEIYVLQNLSRALLRRPAIQALNVAVLIEPVQGDYVVEQFPELSKAWGS